jgi:glycosyltransferase involved in cell wall biosynthesis
MKKKIAIIGTNGVPSKYGGFETLVEYLVKYLANNYDITVFCSTNLVTEKLNSYQGVKLEYINLDANGWQSIFYDIVSIFKSYKRFDKVLVLGCSGSIIMPFFIRHKSKFIMNLGGLDWKRSKWSYFTRKFLKFSEFMAIKFSGHIISDNQGIKEYIVKEYQRNSFIIAYGGDHAIKQSIEQSSIEKYPFLKNPYAFTLARIQPDNNIDMLLDSFTDESPYPLVFVGNWNYSSYGIQTKKKFSDKPGIMLLDAIYDQKELNVLRSNCKVYLHGHSAGGTNPALVEAMYLGLPILAYNSIFNKYTTNFEAEYFNDSKEIFERINSLSNEDLASIGEKMILIGKDKYKWEFIGREYAKVFDIK